MNDRQSDKQAPLDAQRQALDTQSISTPSLTGEPTDAAFALHVDIDAAPRRRINEGLVLLVLVIAVASGVLWLMRAHGAATVDGSFAAVEAKIEAALAQLNTVTDPSKTAANPLSALPENSDQVIAMFVTDPTAQQVKLNQLKHNPFAIIGLQSDGPVAANLSVDPAEQQRRQHLQKLRDELSRLKLQTVMQGRIPMAVISGTVVQQGQSIGSFTVAAVESRSVVLTADGNTYRIDMEDPFLSNVPTD